MTNFGDRNPADVLNEPMWQMFKTFGQKPNKKALKKYCYDLMKMSTQKTAGQRDNKKSDLSWEENLHMTLWGIVIEACALVVSGELAEDGDECLKCEHYDNFNDRCTAFECDGLECPQLPCEK